MKKTAIVLCILALAVSCSCGGKKKRGRAATPCSFSTAVPITPHPPLLTAADAQGDRCEVVFIGDSSIYGPGLKRTEPFPQLIDAYWKSHGIPLSAVNAGFGGITTERTLWRLDDVITKKTCAVFLVIGYNDYYHDQRRISDIRRDYEQLVTKIRSKGVKLFLGEVRLDTPRPGFPAGDLDAYNAIFGDTAKRHGIPLFPDFYQPLIDSALRIPNDGHANRCGHRVHARMVLSFFNSDWDFPLEEPCAGN